METNEKALFLKFVGKVEKRSREKHPEKDWDLIHVDGSIECNL